MSASTACLGSIFSAVQARSVLDVACGGGGFTRTLADMLPGAHEIVGVDPDKDSLDEARLLTSDRRVRFRQRSVEEMTFHDARFDLVAISNALHHLDDPDDALTRMRRVCVPGGLLVVQELISEGLSPAETNGRDVHHLKARVDSIKGLTHRGTYTAENVRAFVARADATIEAECLVVDPDPAPPDSERVSDAIGFLPEYLTFVSESDEIESLRSEARRIVAALLVYGIATPPKLVIRARFAVR